MSRSTKTLLHEKRVVEYFVNKITPADQIRQTIRTAIAVRETKISCKTANSYRRSFGSKSSFSLAQTGFNL